MSLVASTATSLSRFQHHDHARLQPVAPRDLPQALHPSRFVLDEANATFVFAPETLATSQSATARGAHQYNSLAAQAAPAGLAMPQSFLAQETALVPPHLSGFALTEGPSAFSFASAAETVEDIGKAAGYKFDKLSITAMRGFNAWESKNIVFHVSLKDHDRWESADWHVLGTASPSDLGKWQFIGNGNRTVALLEGKLYIAPHVTSFQVIAPTVGDHFREKDETVTIQIGTKKATATIFDDDSRLDAIENSTKTTTDEYNKIIIENRDKLIAQEATFKAYLAGEWGDHTSSFINKIIEGSPTLERFIGMDLYNHGNLPGASDVASRVSLLESKIDAYFQTQRLYSNLAPTVPQPGSDVGSYLQSLISYVQQSQNIMNDLAVDLQKIFSLQASLMGTAPAPGAQDTYTPIQFNLPLNGWELVRNVTYKMPFEMLIQVSNGGEAAGSKMYTYLDHTGATQSGTFADAFFNSYAEFIYGVGTNYFTLELGIGTTIHNADEAARQAMINKILTIVGVATSLVGGGFNNLLGSTMSFVADLAGGKYHSGDQWNLKGKGDALKLAGGYSSMTAAATGTTVSMLNLNKGNLSGHDSRDAMSQVFTQPTDPFNLFSSSLISPAEKDSVNNAMDRFKSDQLRLIDRLDKLVFAAGHGFDHEGHHSFCGYHETQWGEGQEELSPSDEEVYNDIMGHLRTGYGDALANDYQAEVSYRGKGYAAIHDDIVAAPYLEGDHIAAYRIYYESDWYHGTGTWHIIKCEATF